MIGLTGEQLAALMRATAAKARHMVEQSRQSLAAYRREKMRAAAERNDNKG